MILSGWGNHPVRECEVARPERWADVRNLILNADRSVREPGPGATLIARGLGRSYGDPALNPGGVILATRLNRMLAFDPATGTLECEAGVTFAEIIDVFLPRGFFPPVTPGTKFVTIGGAIASDVHGKNHHRDGSFGSFVEELTLLIASGDCLTCSPARNSDVFWATVGGMGLTGIIRSARFRLRPVDSAYISVQTNRTADLDAALDAFEAEDERFPYSVAWIDCLAVGRSLGRTVLIRGEHAGPGELKGAERDHPLKAPRPGVNKNVPFFSPAFLLNHGTIGAFSEIYYHYNHEGRRIVPFDPFFYPLDSIRNWNRLYGRRGFVQYQAFFPRGAGRRGLIELLQRVSASGRASFLAVLKRCGKANEGLLSYLAPGHTLALDLPWGDDIPALLASLDEILLRHGGRLYLAKDACMSGSAFAAMYPRLDEFREIKARLDPNSIFASCQARRLGIVPSGRPRTAAIAAPRNGVLA